MVNWLQFCNKSWTRWITIATENTLLMSGMAHSHVWLCQQTHLLVVGSEHPTWTSPRPLHSAKVTVMCNFFFLQHNWSLFLSECGEMYSNCRCRAVYSHTANISVKWATSLAQFAMVPTGWSNHSHSKLPCKCLGQCLEADSFLAPETSPGPPTRLILRYQIASVVVMSEARYMAHVLPVPMT